jgi:hypothetical protein
LAKNLPQNQKSKNNKLYGIISCHFIWSLYSYGQNNYPETEFSKEMDSLKKSVYSVVRMGKDNSKMDIMGMSGGKSACCFAFAVIKTICFRKALTLPAKISIVDFRWLSIFIFA